MSKLEIVRLGHPALRTPAKALDPDQLDDPATQELIDDLFETMLDAEGVGLAAPQVGLGLQLFVYLAVDLEEPDAEPAERVLINPMVEPVAGELVYDWEGCLSIPDLRGLVPRHQAVRVFALDRDGARIEHRAESYEARIIQHEFDHLNGVVFLDRMRELRSLAFGAEWEAYMTSPTGDEPSVG